MFDWDAENLSHISRRNVSPAQVEQALVDMNAIEGRAYSTEDEHREGIIGRATDGVLLFVV